MAIKLTTEQKLEVFRAMVKSNLNKADEYSHDPEHNEFKFEWQERANALCEVLDWSKVLE